MFEYDFERRRERRRPELSRRGYDEVFPTIWRGRVAFSRTRLAKDHTFRPSQLFVSTDGGRPRAVRGGSRGARDEVLGELGAAPTRLDLRGRRLAFSWTLLAEKGTCPVDPKIGFSRADELWLVELGGARQRVAAGCEYDDAFGYADATFTDDGLSATMVRATKHPVDERNAERLARFSPRGMPTGEVDLTTSQFGSATLSAATQDGLDTYFMVRDPSGRYVLKRQRFFESGSALGRR